MLFRVELWYCGKYQLLIWHYTSFARIPLKTMFSTSKPQHIKNLVDNKIFLWKLERWELGVWSVDETRFYLNLRFNLKGLIINPPLSRISSKRRLWNEKLHVPFGFLIISFSIFRLFYEFEPMNLCPPTIKTG